jgi:hypothetical protein
VVVAKVTLSVQNSISQCCGGNVIPVAKKKKKKVKKWAAEAVKRPGALRDRAEKAGLIGKGETLTAADLNRLEKIARDKDDLRLLRQVNLARTFKKMGGRGRNRRKNPR